MGKLVHEELSYRILGVLFKVHNQLGKGYQEKYYQRAIEKEFQRQGIPFIRELAVPLQYDGEPIGRYFVDFLVDDAVIVEVKVVEQWKPTYIKQVLGYLEATKKPVAILANFAGERLRYKRLVNFTAVKQQLPDLHG